MDLLHERADLLCEHPKWFMVVGSVECGCDRALVAFEPVLVMQPGARR